jgi:hypothetical protein
MGFTGIFSASATVAAARLAARPREADEKNDQRENHDADGDEGLPIHDQKPRSLPP